MHSNALWDCMLCYSSDICSVTCRMCQQNVRANDASVSPLAAHHQSAEPHEITYSSWLCRFASLSTLFTCRRRGLDVMRGAQPLLLAEVIFDNERHINQVQVVMLDLLHRLRARPRASIVKTVQE